MATVTGMRSTGTILQAQRRIDMASKVLELEPSETPLVVLTKNLTKRKAVQPEFAWLERDVEPRFDAINNGAGYTNSATSVAVDNGTRFAQHYLVRVTRTGEVMRVTAVSTNTLTVVRGVGGGAAAIIDNDELLVIGVAQPEGDDIRPARSGNAVKVLNYTEIFRHPFGSTGTNRSSESVTSESDWATNGRLAGIEHKKDIEYAFWLGKPSEDLTDAAKPIRTTGGVLHYANQNITDAGGALTETEFFTSLRPVFRYGSKRKMAFGSALAVDVLNSFPRGKVQVNDSGNGTYGLAVFKYISPHGTVRLITHPLFEGAVLGGMIAFLDMDQLAYRFLSAEPGGSRDTSVLPNRQSPGVDGQIDEYLTECGLEIGLAKTHGFLTGITSAG